MTVVFDLDGVLSRSDTMATVVFSRLRRRPWLVVPVAALAAVAAMAGTRGDVRPRCNRAIVHLALSGLAADGYHRLADEAARRLASRPGNVAPEVVAALRDGIEQGDALVTTATERYLAMRYLTEIGADAAPLHASEFVFTRRGPRFARHNVGAAKVEAFVRSRRDEAIDTLYTDSASDLPLARLSAMTVLVGSSTRAARVLERAGVSFRRLSA
ncbi:HAD family hydrolase [Microbacterium sp. XT11]|uniref:HAD family hydrolase n=1 Tax=Microbacterium sp. XT11 TaxID=367477 RepID=UPI00082CB830|nr:HAD family hydrolase [Microbacterium sp. XT11]